MLVHLHAIGIAAATGVGIDQTAEVHAIGDGSIFVEVVAADVSIGIAVDIEVLAIRRKCQSLHRCATLTIKSIQKIGHARRA